MKRINVIYDGFTEDADILIVPDDIADSIEQVVWDFNIWLEDPQNSQPFSRINEKGYRYLNVDTKEFLWWLNNVKIVDNCKARIEKQHVSFVKEYPAAEF